MHKRLFILIPLVPIILYLVTIAHILSVGFHDLTFPADVAIVLGNKVELNGEPSKRLKARLDAAYDLYKDSLCKNILVSGGVGKEGFDEAEVMKQYLINAGIPAEILFTDSEGNNSYQTALNSKKIAAQQKWSRVIVVSQYFHIARTTMICTRMNFDKVGSYHARYFEGRDLYSTLREGVAFWKYWLRYR